MLFLYALLHSLEYCKVLLLVLNLGHSPLYRHFCKCLYIELLKFRLLFLTVTYIFFVQQFKNKLSLFSLIKNVSILPIHCKPPIQRPRYLSAG